MNRDIDLDAARDEDQVSTQGSGMSPKGSKGPTAASAADVEGAFGDAERQKGGDSASEDTLNEGPMVFDRVGPKDKDSD